MRAQFPAELFTTLVRFDAVYYVHFKCNLRRIADYPQLHRYLRDLHGVPGVAEINPFRIVPIGPILDF